MKETVHKNQESNPKASQSTYIAILNIYQIFYNVYIRFKSCKYLMRSVPRLSIKKIHRDLNNLLVNDTKTYCKLSPLVIYLAVREIFLFPLRRYPLLFFFKPTSFLIYHILTHLKSCFSQLFAIQKQTFETGSD